MRLGGAPLLARCESYQRASHRADMWRYVRLHRVGGYYLDIAQSVLGPRLESQPNLIMSRGPNQHHTVVTWDF